MQNNMVPSAMKSGLTLGVLFSLNFIISLTGVPFVSWFVFGIIIYMTYRFTIQYRDKECGGYLTFGQSFTYIFFSFFFGALISAFVRFIYYQFISPEALNELYTQTMTVLENNPFFSGKKTEEMSYSLQKVLKPAPYALYALFGNMLGSIFVGLIISAFTKKKEDIFD